ncbi:hypothetical protein KP509_25G027300 [Ceratopteris richardii]|nr:hypothetical protein KP509_25G027300 [Ceratopteris richardii]
MDRIDVLELKACIVKKLGTEKANRYFSHFQSFISSRLSKVELDKLVVMTIGRDNVGLHNQFVKAILSNAIKAKTPPPPRPPVQNAGKPPLKPHSPCITSEDAIPHISPSTLSNGDSFLPSPRRGRSLIARDHRTSPLGPREDNPTPDLSRPIQQFEGGARQLDTEIVNSVDHPVKRARVTPSQSDENASILGSVWPQKILNEDEKALILPPLSFGSSIKAPLGAPFHFGTTDTGFQRSGLHAFPAQALLQDGRDKEYDDSGELPNNDLMHRLMEEAAASEGLEGVSKESAVLLNLSLDMYLKRLIKSSIDFMGLQTNAGVDSERVAEATSTWDKVKESFINMKQHRGINGVSLGPTAELLKKGKEKTQTSLSITDFKAAMDLYPQQLGENWPVQLEKISFRIFDQ